MAESPNKSLDGVLGYKIVDDSDTDIGSKFMLLSFKINKEINKIGKALLVLDVTDAPDGTVEESDDTAFDVGKVIIIKAGYGDELATVFGGVVIYHNVEIDSEGHSSLNVECREQPYFATQVKGSELFLKKTDDAIIREILSRHELAIDVEACDVEHEQIKKHFCSDWDYALARANINGLIVIVDGKNVSIKVPAVDKTSGIELTNGNDIIEFSAKLNTVNQFKTVESKSWDYTTGEEIVAQSVMPELNEHGSDEDKPNQRVYTIQTSAPVPMNVLQKMANAKALEMGLARIEGSCKFCGNTSVKIGEVIKLKGFGKRFDGKAYIVSVDHDFDEDGWTTSVKIGAPSMDVKEDDVTDGVKGVGTMQSAKGLHVATVTKLEGDPQEQHRIEVEVPMTGGDSQLMWARLSNLWGNSGYGIFFIPEVGDEVILGFFNNDPSYPVILGTMHSSVNAPAYEIKEDNFIQAITTKSAMKLQFDEEKKIITIETPGKNIITISDEDKGIMLKDQNDNIVVMCDSGVLIESKKKLTLKAANDIEIDAGGNLIAKAKTDIKMEGMNVEAKAKAAMTVKGTANAEFSASGNTTIKGAMVMIN